MPDLEHCLAGALAAAAAAGEFALSYFRCVPPDQIGSKTSSADLVSIADRQTEQLLKSRLADVEPQCGFIGEETWREGSARGDYSWVVDPIDGTSNYLSGLPLWGISIALCDAVLQPLLGVIHAPALRQTWSCVRGQGAFRDGSRIAVRRELPAGGQYNSMLATGFPYDTTRHGTNLDYFSRMQLRFHKIRRLGSAALDLAFVAEGIFDGMWELKLKPWDTAAGVLLVSEAGGVYSQIDGALYTPGDVELVVAARQELLALMCAVLGGFIA